jgi:hypothetical protein
MNVRVTGQLQQHLLVKSEHVGIVIQEQDFVAGSGFCQLSHSVILCAIR